MQGQRQEGCQAWGLLLSRQLPRAGLVTALARSQCAEGPGQSAAICKSVNLGKRTWQPHAEGSRGGRSPAHAHLAPLQHAGSNQSRVAGPQGALQHTMDVNAFAGDQDCIYVS